MPKAIDTLHVLIERRGQVVDKAELMKLVWPDCTVEEIGLARNISLLRKALGDEYIETVPKRGYRFAAAPAQPPVRRHRRAWLAAAGAVTVVALIYWQFYAPSRYLPRGGFAVLAVVPFECLDEGAEDAAFARGFTGALVTEINRLGSVQVISPGTVDRYRSLHVPVAFMTRVLGAQVAVEGTVQKLDEGFRVAVRLADVHSGRLIWAETYDAAAGGAEPARTAAAAISACLRKLP